MRVEQSEEEETISYYLMAHYNWQGPHQFNDDVPPAKAENLFNSLSGISCSGLIKPDTF